MTSPLFTEAEQEEFRKEFVKESRLKAWSAICHTDWAATEMVAIETRMHRMEAEHTGLTDEMEAISKGIDYHSVESRQKVKEFGQRRAELSKKIEETAGNIQKILDQVNEMTQTAKGNLRLAEHAKTFKWEDLQDENIEKAMAEHAAPASSEEKVEYPCSEKGCDKSAVGEGLKCEDHSKSV